MDVKVYSYLNPEAVEAHKAKAQKLAEAKSASDVSALDFDETYDLAKKALKAMNVDAALEALKNSGENGFRLDSKLAYELGLTNSYSGVDSTSGSSGSSDSGSTSSGSKTSVDLSSLPVDVTGHTTKNCPSHSGTSGYSNSGTLQCSDELQAYFEQAAAATGVDVKLLKAVAYCESSFNPNDLSSAGAMGVMQLMPCNVEDYSISDPYDAEQNILGGACELADYLNKYDGDLELSLAAYNAGSGTVRKYGGVPSFCENYINKVITLYNS